MAQKKRADRDEDDDSFDETVRAARKLAARHRVTDGSGFKLSDHDPDDTGEFGEDDKEESGEVLAAGVKALARLQESLYAQDHWAVLLIFQAMDAAGKDSVIKHVMAGVNPQGCQVHSFKVPSPEELDHDYLWRCLIRLPNRGNIGIFNRSYYEETLVVRVHPEFLERQHLPRGCVTKDVWKDRFRDIRAFERYLSSNGVLVRKFFLHVSKDEQRKRFLERIEKPEKNWKFSSTDVKERAHWDEYMRAYEDAIRSTSTDEAPWYVVPADHKWYTRMVVSAAIVSTMADLDLSLPPVDAARRRELAAARKALQQER